MNPTTKPDYIFTRDTTPDEAAIVEVLYSLVGFIRPEDAKESVTARAVAIYNRASLAQKLSDNEAGSGWPHTKVIIADWLQKKRRWIPVTEAHWHYWVGVVPPSAMRHDMVLVGEEYSDDYAFAVYHRTAGHDGEATYWATLATRREVVKGDIRLTIPFAEDMPVFRDMDKEDTDGDAFAGVNPTAASIRVDAPAENAADTPP